MNIYIFTQSSSFFYIGMSIAKLRRRKKNRLSLREGKGREGKDKERRRGKSSILQEGDKKPGRPVTDAPTLLY